MKGGFPMNETLHLVNKKIMENMEHVYIVIASVTKTATDYHYVPKNLSVDTTPRWRTEQRTSYVPPILAIRVFAEDSPHLEEWLAEAGLEEYDAWELLKTTDGTKPSDNARVWTAEQLQFAKDTFPGLVIDSEYDEMVVAEDMVFSEPPRNQEQAYRIWSKIGEKTHEFPEYSNDLLTAIAEVAAGGGQRVLSKSDKAKLFRPHLREGRAIKISIDANGGWKITEEPSDISGNNNASKLPRMNFHAAE